MNLVTDNFRYYFDKGVQNFIKNNFKSAINHFNHSLIQNNFGLNAYINLISSLVKNKQYQEALKMANVTIVLKPYNSLCYFNKAAVLIKMEEFQQALLNIQCALSCEYLKQYQRLLKIQSLQRALKEAHNNIEAFKLMIIHKRLRNFSNKEILNDFQVFKKLFNHYEANFDADKIASNNLIVNMENGTFYLRSQLVEYISNQQKKIRTKMIIKQLKRKRQIYLDLLKQNQNHLSQIQQNINSNLTKTDQLKGKGIKIIQQIQFLNDYSELNSFMNQPCIQQQKKQVKSIETLQLTKQSLKPIKLNDKQNNEDQNIKTQEKSLKNSKLYHKSNKNIKALCDNNKIKDHNKIQKNQINHKKFVNKELSQIKKQNDKINKTTFIQRQKNQINKNQIIKSNKHTNRNRNNKQLKHLNSIKVKLFQSGSKTSLLQSFDKRKQNEDLQIQSICSQVSIIEQNNERQSKRSTYNINIHSLSESQCFDKNQNNSKSNLLHNPNQMSYQFLSPEPKLKINKSYQNLNSSYFIGSKSSHNIIHPLNLTFGESNRKIQCSKCFIDHYQLQKKDRNVQIQINLTEIYNLGQNCKNLNPFCKVYYQNNMVQETSISQGRFPNWKQKIFVMYDEKNTDNQFVQIQLWNKNKVKKYDQMIGRAKATIKFGKSKVILQNQFKKIAYMYINTSKTKLSYN